MKEAVITLSPPTNIKVNFPTTFSSSIKAVPLTETLSTFDVKINVQGGGYTGQSGAMRHGITRALMEVSADYRPALKAAGFVTRDPRAKERKKYGLKGARRAPQFSKR